MSSDNGYIIRQNSKGEYVAQTYFAGDEKYPDVEQEGLRTYNTLEEAVLQCTEPTEYGLTIDIGDGLPQFWTSHEDIVNQEKESSMELTRYASKPFYVDAVEVTEENMQEVAKWCKGSVRQMPTADVNAEAVNFIKVRVHHPRSDRQTKAFVGDRVLHGTANGFKVYTPNAFDNAFVAAPLMAQGVPVEVIEDGPGGGR